MNVQYVMEPSKIMSILEIMCKTFTIQNPRGNRHEKPKHRNEKAW